MVQTSVSKSVHRLSNEGLKLIEEKLMIKGWNKYEPDWCEAADVSESTLKRFLSGERISRKNFKGLCEAIGLTEWHTLLFKDNMRDSQQVVGYCDEMHFIASNQSMNNEVLASFVMTGLLTESKRQQVIATLEHLKKLLMEIPVVTLFPNDSQDSLETLVVSGSFAGSKRQQILAILEHLKNLLIDASFSVC
jgi:hypothetical protein